MRQKALKTLAAALACTSITACNDVEEHLVTSPLVGAEQTDTYGVAEVQEVLTAGRYAYLRLSDAEPGVWHVVSGAQPEAGTTVSYRGYARLQNFESKRLGRSFDVVVFSSTKPLHN